MPTTRAIEGWVEGWRSGRQSAARNLCHVYEADLLALARRRLRSHAALPFDEQDVVMQALKSFLGGLRDGRFPGPLAGVDLTRLVRCLLRRKTTMELRRFTRQKRAPQRRAAFSKRPACRAGAVAAWIPERLQTAEFLEHLLQRLADEELRQITRLKLEGYTLLEIAQSLGRSLATIERRMRLIRDIWLQEFCDESRDPTATVHLADTARTAAPD